MRPSPLLVLVVTVGGALGTTGRYAVTHLIGTTHLIPWATLLVNVVGAFLLGLLLERLSRAGPETPARQVVRLGLGTGVLGGFTTYSALALELHDLLAAAEVAAAVAYGVGSVCAGLVACAGGIALGARGDRP
ncbi:CrcB family protein [Ornithinimicrobium faecis]|uniref:Fluoride-specific ion channel FluC n=1 Tax=Ornithinimicrobium faecis TaxID=2934158 RepID=A0ABY4YUK6_9MICO|nr:CrcB family protein [Ornithinimicrobium sp. HY1793]USQ79940.1 CrcB family protein [Ornithinimicrobium sp. HY1793]